MKNKGFIATSLIYSFFLIFCMVLLAVISTSAHNKNLLNRANENIRTDLMGKTLGESQNGSYVTLTINHLTINTSDVKWIVFSSDDSETLLVSDSVVLSAKDIDNDLSNDLSSLKSTISNMQNSCVSSVRIINIDDFNKMKNNADSKEKVLAFAGAGSISNINIINDTDNTNYIIETDTNSYQLYTYKPSSSNNLTTYKNEVFNNLSNLTSDNELNVRLVISIASNVTIIGGNGNFTNPYSIDSSKCFNNLTLANKILKNRHDNHASITTPGEQIAVADEGLRSTTDDYGTSYYFRGAVENNYLIFANMCWQIVRITGNGSIKLVLYNGTEPKCSKYDVNITSAYNSEANVYSYNAGVGFMYGEENSQTYALEHTNNNKSTILTTLETWYNNNLANYDAKLADVIWCADKSTTDNGYGISSSNYGTYNRLNNPTSSAPTLLCPVDKNSGKLSKFTTNDATSGNGALTYKIGLLTADEVAFAGAIYGTVKHSTFGRISGSPRNCVLCKRALSPDWRALLVLQGQNSFNVCKSACLCCSFSAQRFFTAFLL